MTAALSSAAICEALDGPDAVQISRLPLVPLRAGEMRVRLKAAALNFPDLLMTYGKYQFRPEPPFTLGMEGAGVVEEIADGIPGYKIGDRVLVKSKTGAFAEHMTVNAQMVEPMPPHLTFEEGAAFAVTFMTANVALIDRAKLQTGEILLVLGAGGGVGQATVAWGHAMGAMVIAGASSDEKLEIARQSGADYLVNYDREDFAKAVNRITKGAGADVILDPVGGYCFENSLNCIAFGGRIVVAGFAGGRFGILRPDLLKAKGAAVVGVRAGEFGRRDPAAGKRSHARLLEFSGTHNLRPVIGRSWLLQDVPGALRAMERREVSGKQIILIEK